MKLMFLNGAMTGHEVELIPSGTTIGRETDNAILSSHVITRLPPDI